MPSPTSSTDRISTQLLATIRTHLSSNDRPAAIDATYDTLDGLLLLGRIDAAAAVIDALATGQLPLPILLSALTVSLPWRETLGPARMLLVVAARAAAMREGGEEKARAALMGLE